MSDLLCMLHAYYAACMLPEVAALASATLQSVCVCRKPAAGNGVEMMCDNVHS